MNNNRTYKNHTFGSERKKTKYLEDKMIQCAVNGDIEEFEELSNEFDNINYQRYLYYPLKHGRLEMIEHFLSKLGTISHDYLLRSIGRNKELGTNQLLNLINSIDDKNINTERLFEYREHIVSYFTHECFRKYYPEKLILGIDLIEPEEAREPILNDFIKNASEGDTPKKKIFYELLIPLLRERNIENLLKLPKTKNRSI